MRNLAQQTNSDLMLCLGNTTNRYTLHRNLALFTNEWGFFMATTPRKTQTPGAKKETLATAQPSADDVLDSVLGKPDAPAETPEQPKTAEDDESNDLPAFDLDQLLVNQDAILDGQKRIENKLDQLLSSAGIEASKKKRWVQGEKGLEHKEI